MTIIIINPNANQFLLESPLAISSNISLDRFYSDQDELEVINELISLSNSKNNQKIIFLWPEGTIPYSNLGDMKLYENLFSDNFNKNHLIIMGINNLEEYKKEYYK